MDTIALFGGSFDPPHIGHKAIVKALEKLEYIDKTIIVPAFLNPFKSESFLSANERLSLVKDMFSDFKNIEISNFEIKKQKQVPSIETVNHFLKIYKKVYLVIGADNLSSLQKWKNYNELQNLVTFIVAKRNGITIPKEYITLNIDENISSTQIRKQN